MPALALPCLNAPKSPAPAQDMASGGGARLAPSVRRAGLALERLEVSLSLLVCELEALAGGGPGRASRDEWHALVRRAERRLLPSLSALASHRRATATDSHPSGAKVLVISPQAWQAVEALARRAATLLTAGPGGSATAPNGGRLLLEGPGAGD